MLKCGNTHMQVRFPSVGRLRRLSRWCIFIEKCFLSPSISVDQMETYERMGKLVAHLCFAAMGFSILAQGLYKETNPGRSASPYESYCWYWRITACVVGSYACHQLASALACRPMEVIFDFGFFSMLILQMGTFVSCLAFANTLGAKFALCKRLEWKLIVCCTEICAETDS